MTRDGAATMRRSPLVESDLAGLEQLLKALADRTRLRILALLLDGERCVCEIRQALRVPQPKVSRHLGRLRRAGLVEARRDRLWVHYALDSPNEDCRRALVTLVGTCVGGQPAGRRDRRRLRIPLACCPPQTSTSDTAS